MVMLDYLTDDHKELIKRLVEETRKGTLTKEFYVVWVGDTGQLNRKEFTGDNPPTITKGVLDVLEKVGLLDCKANSKTETSSTRSKTTYREREMNRRCTLTGKAYKAVDSNFELPSPVPTTQQNIGTLIQGNVSGGTFQSIGFTNAQVSQIVNDSTLLQSQVDTLIEALLETVKPELTGNDLIEYIQAATELKQLLLTEEPPTLSLFKRVVSTLSFLDVVNGTTDLMVKIWPVIYPLIQIANELHKGLPG